MILNRMLMVMSMQMYRLCLEVQLGIAFCFASVGVDNIRDNLFLPVGHQFEQMCRVGQGDL